MRLIRSSSSSIFWVRADDLQSSSAIGITCMLSIIAFQLAQANSLPQVPYLTIADRVDQLGRRWFPVLTIVLAARSIWGWYASSAEDADVYVPPARSAPAGVSEK